MTSRIWLLTFCGVPTKPRLTAFSTLEVGSLALLRVFLATSKSPSLPDRPTAVPPAALSAVTICLLIAPARTISTTSMVCASVTRRPFLKLLLIFNRSSMAAICGPPPCTMTGLMPDCLSSTTSCANWRASTSSPMAWPPYLTTTVFLS